MTNIGKEYADMLGSLFGDGKRHPLLIGNEFMAKPSFFQEVRQKEYQFLESNASVNNWNLSFNLKQILKPSTAVIVTDTNQKIQWVSSYFSTMTGYEAQEAIGKKPSFLQGEKTCKQTTALIRSNLSRLKKFKGTIINYRKSGKPYTCHVQLLPVFDTKGIHTNFIAFENDK